MGGFFARRFTVRKGPRRSCTIQATKLPRRSAFAQGTRRCWRFCPLHGINRERLSALVGGKVHILDERKCAELFPDCEAGAAPPFGELYGLPVYMDQTLVENPEIVFCAGTLSEGIRMGNVEFIHLVKPKVGEFAEKS
jgi:hypothetical protein